jgi:hypothetical protein
VVHRGLWPAKRLDKRSFLQELQAIRDLHSGSWIVARDFNMIVDRKDKNQCILHRGLMGSFRWTLSNLELKEVYLNGRRFTDPMNVYNQLWRNWIESSRLWTRKSCSQMPSYQLCLVDLLTTARWCCVCPPPPDLHQGRRFQIQYLWTKVDGHWRWSRKCGRLSLEIQIPSSAWTINSGRRPNGWLVEARSSLGALM